MLSVEPKVKECHGPAIGDGELTLNLTLPPRGEICDFWMGAVSASCLPPAPETEAPLLLICLSVCRSSSLSLSPFSLFLSLSSLAICM